MTGGVLLAHDLSDRAREVTRAAGDLAVRLGLPLSVLHVVSDDDLRDLKEAAPAQSAYVDVLFDDLKARVRAEVESSLEGRSIDAVDVRIARGDSSLRIVEALRERGYDYAVIGIRSRSRVGKLVFGSSAQSILLSSPCPVVAVPVAED